MPVKYDAVLVVAFGGPEKLEDVPEFLGNISKGRDIPQERLDEVTAVYESFGGASPHNRFCREFTDSLAEVLRQRAQTDPAQTAPPQADPPGIDVAQIDPPQTAPPPATPLPVYWGNRNWHPYLADTVQQMAADGVQKALAFVTSGFSSYPSCRQYLENLQEALDQMGNAPANGKDSSSIPSFGSASLGSARHNLSSCHNPPAGSAVLEIHKLRGFFNHPAFIASQATAVLDAVQDQVSKGVPQEAIRVIFAAHSLPESIAQVCNYEAQIKECAQLVIEQATSKTTRQVANQDSFAGDPSHAQQGVPELKLHGWDIAYVSRSGPPTSKWLGPDITEHLPAVAFYGKGPQRLGRCQSVVAVPLGFLFDHMEVINDLDVQAAQVAAEYNLEFTRAATVGTTGGFVEMVADLIEERLNPEAPRPALGSHGALPDFCATDCCLPKAG